MPIVLDASIVAAWVLPDESSLVAAKVMMEIPSSGGVVPAIWPFELRNTFLVAERRGRIDPQSTASFIASIARLPLAMDPDAELDTVLEIARRHRLTVYDAAYLELALRMGAPLATLDGALLSAAKATGVAFS